MTTFASLLVLLAAVVCVTGQPLPKVAPAPPGVYYNPEGLPAGNMTTPVFPRCPNATFDCQPFTSPDIPVTYLMQTTTNLPEQIQVVPADVNGQYYAVTFTIPQKISGSSMGGVLKWSHRRNLGRSTSVACKPHRYHIYPKTSASYYKSGYIYFCYIGPLTDSKPIYYKVTAPARSARYHFKPHPLSGDLTPVKFGLVADLGQTGNASSTLDNLLAGKPDITLFAGDLNYADNVSNLLASKEKGGVQTADGWIGGTMPVHVTVGDGGNDEGVAGPAFRDYYFGHSEIVFHNSTIATYTWLRNIDGGRVADQFTLTSKLAMGCPKV